MGQPKDQFVSQKTKKIYMMHCCSEKRMITIIWSFCLFFCLSHSTLVIAKDLCLPDQKDALWDFKNEFSVQRPDWMMSDTATEKWRNNTDCCSWKGVLCNNKTGKVVKLHLYNSYLTGPLRSNSSLFRLQQLQSLELSHNNLSCMIPYSIGNLKYLRVLSLAGCDLFGKIPSSLGNLTYLTDLALSFNDFTSELPDSMGNLKHLRVLDLIRCSISGKIPSSLGSLSNLARLLLLDNDLTNEEGPDSMANLNQLTDFQLVLLNLTSLIRIDLGSNQFKGMLPSNMSSLSKLEVFVIKDNSFSGTVPSSLFMIPSLISIDLSRNDFSGSLETGNNISSQSNLQTLYMGENNFSGPIPRFITELVGLSDLSLSYWDTGRAIVDFSIFLHHKSLTSLDLSGIHLNISSTLHLPSPMKIVVLSSCNIDEFPKFLETPSLWYLDISANKIEGQVPEWLWRLPTLRYVNIAHNSFSGEITMLPNSIMNTFIASDNQFSGEIPRAICGFDHLSTLVLSNNNFSGSIPRCFEMFNSSLWILHLWNNSLSGVIPDDIIKDGLISLDVGSNQLSGQLPKSLINCSNLEFLNVEDNIIKDKFPFWLSSLPNLQILVLRSNEFYGPITSHGGFSKLRIFDVSENSFSGVLPSDYFVGWSVMSTSDVAVVDIMPAFGVLGYDRDSYRRSVVLTIKGLELALVGSDFSIYKTIDVSGNRLQGDIPESIGMLKELILLNMSNNAFTGYIPPSLSNLSNLQSLDLSRNRLSGNIPTELGKLTFLARMNFSYNRLEGPIPQATQIQSQNSSSFVENPALCGAPLLKKCGGQEEEEEEEEDGDEEKEGNDQVFSWIAAAIGYVPGLFCGLTIAYMLTL